MKGEKAKDVESAKRWRLVAGVLFLLCLGLLVAVVVLAVLKTESDTETAEAVVAKIPCKKGNSIIDTSDPDNPGVFDDLTHNELKAIQEYIYGVPELKLVRPKEAKTNTSYLFIADYIPPKKSEALQYLDGNGKMPVREARVIIFRGDQNPAQVEEYIVGPLPKPTYHKLMKLTSRKNPVPYAHRPLGGVELGEVFGQLYSVIDREIGFLLKESYDATFTSCAAKCLSSFVSPISTAILNQDVRKMWIVAKHNIEYYSIQPVDISFLANIDGPDSSKFRIEKVIYADQVYPSLQDLASAYNSTTKPITKTKVEFPKYNDNLFSAIFRRDSSSSGNPQRPAKSVEPDGKRYSIKHREITFKQWKFNFRMSTLTGPQIFDVRFGGERIAYEISLQEIAAFYSGQSAAQKSADYIDSGFLVGTHADALVPGADCPESATFLHTTILGDAGFDPIKKQKSICVFEVDTGIPLRRHLSYSYAEGGFYSGLSDVVLTLRTIVTLVNYDYIFDFVFHESGALEVRTISTGYIISSFYTDKKGPYGFRIHDNMIGNIHHHMFHWKADVDILGTKNRYETLDITTDVVNNTLSSGIPQDLYTQIRFDRSLKRTEQEALYKFDFDHPKYLIIHNNDKKSKHGVPRSYRIHLAGMSKQLTPENKGKEMALSWARHQLVVTKHKDDEMGSSSCYALFDNRQPTVMFSNFTDDNDNIVDEDLVAWIALGIHHIPHTEDLPITPTAGSHLSFFLLPYNYFDECPSGRSRDAIRVALKNRDKPEDGVVINRYGNTRGVECEANMPDYDKEVEENPTHVLQNTRE